MSPDDYMREAIRLANEGMHCGNGGPFGCVIVQRGDIVGRGNNCVLATNDPTAHAEITAIRDACARLKTFLLSDCELYTSCEPCPMCLAAIYWARIPVIYYANTRKDAADIGFDDDFIYQQVPLPPDERAIAMKLMLRDEALAGFKTWAAKPDRTMY